MIDPEDWLNWWRAGFVADIHRTWHDLPWFTLTATEQQILYQDSPSAVRSLCQIDPARVSQPEQRVMIFIDLSPMRQKGMLRLLSALCNEDFQFLNPDDQAWCDRIVRAIRPKSFLPTGIDYSDPVNQLSLFRSVFIAPVWARLRLRFSQEVVLQSEVDAFPFPGMNMKRLRAMVDVALWRMEK